MAEVVIIGGGPAGLMAAGRAAERGKETLLLECGPQPGRKLLLTGGGHCNITNTAELSDFIAAFGKNGAFLRTAFHRFGNRDLMDWLSERGVETVADDEGRVLPASGKASTILQCLRDYATASGARIETDSRVAALIINKQSIAGVVVGGRNVPALAVVVATGGMSYPSTGSTGDGYELARQAGHSIVPVYPTLVALDVEESWAAELQGTPTGVVGVAIMSEQKVVARASGECVWTDAGISGPPVLDVSGAAALALRAGDVFIKIDMLPAIAVADLDAKLSELSRSSGKHTMVTVLSQFVPRRTAVKLLELIDMDPARRIGECTRTQRASLVRALKELRLKIRQARPIADAMVTGGGVSLGEIDPRRMQSRLVNGLFFAGEVLDIQGRTGGFNLQAAISTGFLAGDCV